MESTTIEKCTSYEQNNIDSITKELNSVSMESSTIVDQCAACSKEGDSLKACTACFMVKYCNRDCQIAHRSKHKKACKKRAAELHDEKLFKEVEPTECPICMEPLPYLNTVSRFNPCCGKTICIGCMYEMLMSTGKDLCAFCRTPDTYTEEETLKRLNNLMDNGNADAFYTVAGYHTRGMLGLPRDHQKANELFLKGGEHGCAAAYFNLGNSYNFGRGVEVDKKKAKHYYELGAIGGDVQARHNLGLIEEGAGNRHRAIKHYMIGARAGHEMSLDNVKNSFRNGVITKDEYASTLRGYQKTQDAAKSEAREKAASFHRFMSNFDERFQLDADVGL